MNLNTNDAMAIVEIFQQATSDSIRALSACGRLRCLEKGEHLFLDKEPVEHLYIVISGLVTLTEGLIQVNDGQITIPDRDKLSKYFKLP